MNLNFETDGLNFNNKGKPDEIATPQHICDDMSNLFDYADCNKKIWADIYCKTGNTLTSLKKHDVPKENILAICDNKQSQMLICRKLYGKILPEIEIKTDIKSLETYEVIRRGQIYYVNNWVNIVNKHYQDAYNIIKFVILKEMETTMGLEFTSEEEFNINNIIMNPPYNNDIYLDFVTLAHKIAYDSVVAITPAKWQAKGGAKNEQFRKDIVPYMSNIVYYPDCTDVFAIGDPGGISYFLTDKDMHNEKTIINISLKHKSINKDYIYNDTQKRHFNNILSNIGNDLINKIGNYKSFSVENILKNKRYEAWSANKVSLVSNIPKTYLWSSDGVFNCLGLIEIIDTTKGNKKSTGIPEDSRLIYTADTKDECEYFKSWAYTKFIRFLLSLSLCGLTGIATSDEWWRFVPDPGKFDHIFTDEELYKKYNLTDEEINIIESIIKERK